jgi:hypothetical protein
MLSGGFQRSAELAPGRAGAEPLGVLREGGASSARSASPDFPDPPMATPSSLMLDPSCLCEAVRL